MQSGLKEKAGRLERDEIAPQIAQVMALLTELEASRGNITIFNIFDSVCPANDRYC